MPTLVSLRNSILMTCDSETQILVVLLIRVDYWVNLKILHYYCLAIGRMDIVIVLV